MSATPEDMIPAPGEWPVDPQDDVPISDNRIWVDGCFDFSHHGMTPFARTLHSTFTRLSFV